MFYFYCNSFAEMYEHQSSQQNIWIVIIDITNHENIIML